MSRLQTKYQKESRAKLAEELSFKNPHQIPKLDKIVINVGLGRATQDKRFFEVATNTLRKITGQQPVKTLAKHSIAGFKLREGVAIGLKVTLRGERMYEFLDRLVSIVLPRLRDFRGLSVKAFDPQGNYSIGLTDQTVFAELSYEDTTTLHGLQINIVTTGSDKQASRRFLELLGIPFERTANPTKAQSKPELAAVGAKSSGGQNG